MKVKITVQLATGEQADFHAHLGARDGKVIEAEPLGSDLQFTGYDTDATISRDIRDVVAELLTQRFAKTGVVA